MAYRTSDELQDHRLVFQVVELLPGHLRAGLEINEVQGLADLHVVAGGKGERRGLSPGAQLQVPGFPLRNGSRRVGHVGDLQRLCREILLRLLMTLFEIRDAFLQALAFLDERGALLGAELALHAIRVRVARGAQGLQLFQELVSLVVEPHHEVRIRRHVPMRDVRAHRLHIVTDELQIEHAGIIADLPHGEWAIERGGSRVLRAVRGSLVSRLRTPSPCAPPPPPLP